MTIEALIAELTQAVAEGDRAAAQREHAIIQAIDLGVSTAAIAAAAGISTRRVRQIARRHGLGQINRGRPKTKNDE